MGPAEAPALRGVYFFKRPERLCNGPKVTQRAERAGRGECGDRTRSSKSLRLGSSGQNEGVLAQAGSEPSAGTFLC